MREPHLVVLPDPTSLAQAAAERFVDAAATAVNTRGVFTVAVSGGSTPKAMFKLLATQYASRVDWAKIELYFVDERGVAPDHADSNYRTAHEALLAKVPIPPANVHRMRGEIDANDAAIEYGRLLKARFGDGGVDQCWLGMGDDGHTASLFPHTPAIHETHHRCVAQFVEQSTTGPSWRITLTAPFINRSAEVIVLAAGTGKADRLKEVLHGPTDVARLPIQLIAPASGKLIWMLDHAAAAKVSRV